MRQVTPIATAVIAGFVVFSTALRAWREHQRAALSGRPVRTWYLVFCTVVVVMAVVGALLVILGQS